MNVQEKQQALIEAVEEIAKKEGAYWEDEHIRRTFENCYVSTAKDNDKISGKWGSLCIYRRYCSDVAERFLCTGGTLPSVFKRISDSEGYGKRSD